MYYDLKDKGFTDHGQPHMTEVDDLATAFALKEHDLKEVVRDIKARQIGNKVDRIDLILEYEKVGYLDYQHEPLNDGLI